ncbi:NAD/NADP-dependent octopine/nopaline dehydrogenase family protein [Nitratireductor sp. ZSWI3]|uniref:NAD/NADP-dependent octopine/nopaline dehydrogenase family protein n=1 Tax=Nitratireductor sp. ZSWI3 TaxID=2966359 RepID=UPI0021506744|nr:NAD/NADP-dependent octopine/nopaline dehydrogenase family protein [Nitratireductor sp. ZSWI3]MCR4264592.1 NAD/NADP octopine/nopaline dehydrogenase family protein [Nitratireductor sp. ZSWI3]
MKIAVLGGGNGSYAAAADFAEGGHEVRWWRRDRESFADVAAAGGITLTDHKGSRPVAVVPTDDLAAAVKGAELIVAPTPAFAQESIAARLAPILEDGQVIYLPPGTFGSYIMMKRIREAGSTADIAIAETGTLPWLTRKQGPLEVRVTTRASRLPTGVLPARHTDRAIAVIAAAFPASIEPVEDALSGALMNAGPIIHPPLILMNAGPIEHFERWDIHNEGTQPAIRRTHTALDNERIAIREALGYRAPHFPLADHYETSDWMYGNLAHDKLVGSGDWHETLDLKTHRYMLEDVGMGLAFLVSVGDWAGIPCPVAAGLLAIAGAVAERDFRTEGRTMERLGLAGESREGLQAMLREGL